MFRFVFRDVRSERGEASEKGARRLGLEDEDIRRWDGGWEKGREGKGKEKKGRMKFI